MSEPRKREPWNPLLKSYPESEKINAVSIGAETMYTRLIAKADDRGNYYGDPALILAYLFGHRFAAGTVSGTDTARWRDELETVRLVTRYEAGTQTYLHVINPHRRLRKDVKPDEQFPREPDDANDVDKVLSEHGPNTARTRPEHGPLDQDQTKTKTKTRPKKKKTSRVKSNTADILPLKGRMNRITEAYKSLKEVEPKGNEWLPIQNTIKLMFADGRTEEEIITCMTRLAEASKNGCEWLHNWTINTVRLKIAESIAGKLVLESEEDKAQAYAQKILAQGDGKNGD